MNETNYMNRCVVEESIRIHGSLYTAEETFTPALQDVERYFLLPSLNLIIPSTKTAQDSYSLYLAKKGLWNEPELLISLPSCSPEVLSIILSQGSWEILPVLRHLLVVKPIRTLSPMQREAIQNKKKHIPFYKRTPSQHPKGDIDLSDL
jgi:hypothetical protein